MCLIEKSLFPSHQDKSIALIYINRFAIDESDQFEINAVYFVGGVYITRDKISRVVEKLTTKKNQGSDKCDKTVWHACFFRNSNFVEHIFLSL